MKKLNASEIKEGKEMEKTVRARYWKGSIEPLERLELEEGKELIVTIKEVSKERDGFERSAGAWRGTIDAEKLVKDIYNSRSIRSRAKVSL